MNLLLIFMVMLFLMCIEFVDNKINCNIQKYVLSGMSFFECQKDVIERFILLGNGQSDPCPILKNIFRVCSADIENCLDERGYERGRLIFLELLALQFQKYRECPNFDRGGVFNSSKSGTQNYSENETCSVQQEAAMYHQIGSCAQQFENNFVPNLMSSIKNHNSSFSDKSKSSAAEIHQEVFDELMCRTLFTIKKNCFVDILDICYDDLEINYHLTFLLQMMRLQAEKVTLQLDIPHLHTTSSSMSQKCPDVFKELTDLDGFNIDGTISRYRTAFIIVTILSIGLILTFFIIGFVKTTRLMPRIKAAVQLTPYEDIIVTESNFGNSQ